MEEDRTHYGPVSSLNYFTQFNVSFSVTKPSMEPFQTLSFTCPRFRATKFVCAFPSLLHSDQFLTSINQQPPVSGFHYTSITLLLLRHETPRNIHHLCMSNPKVLGVKTHGENHRQELSVDILILRCTTLYGF